MTPLSSSIKRTLAYFGLFDYPLTKEELFANLWRPPAISYDEFVQNFQSGMTAAEKWGYFFSPGKEGSVESRRRRLPYAEEKMRVAVRAAKRIRSVPFLRAVFVCNSVGSGMSAKESDIDFFVIAAPRRLWLVRFFTNLILRLTNLRTYGSRSKDKICLSFYVDENNLNLRPLSVIEEDIHFAYWLNQMIPIYDPYNYYGKFLSLNNWVNAFLPNIKRTAGASYLNAAGDSTFGRIWKKLWEKMWGGAYGDLLEGQTKAIQMHRFKPALKQAAERKEKGVVMSDAVLKFHENDRRREIFEKWKSAANL